MTSYVDAACCNSLLSCFLYVGARDLAGEASLDLVLQTGD